MTEEKADQIIRCVKECWWRVLLVIAIPVFLIALLLRGWPVIVTIEDGMAAWVQAIGSIAAFVGAVALYFMGEHHRRINQKKEEARHVTDVMRSVEALAYTLVVTMDKLYDEHYQYGLKEHLPDGDEDAVTVYQLRNEILGVKMTYEDFCEARANVIKNCYEALSSIDWSKPPVSKIGIFIVSITNEFQFFFTLLTTDEDGEYKRNKLREHATSVSSHVINAAEVLKEAYGYQSQWTYRNKAFSWVGTR